MVYLTHTGSLITLGKYILHHPYKVASLSRLLIKYRTNCISRLPFFSQQYRFLRESSSCSCPLMNTRDKIAIVTGAASGIGYSITQCLVANKAKVLMVDIDEVKGLNAVKFLTQAYGCNCVEFYHADVTCEGHQLAFFRKCSDCFGRVDILINNASVWNETDWRYTVDVNFKAVMDSMLLSFQYMRDGLIMNISSTLAFKPNASSAIFCGTKRSVLGLTRSLSDAFYFKKYNNRICTLCPGITNTNIAKSARCNLRSKELQEEFDKALAFEDMQDPEVVASAVIYLIQKASHGSTWVVENGDLYMIDIPDYKSLRVPKTLRFVSK